MGREYLLDNNHIVLDYVKNVDESKLLIKKTLTALNIECIGGHANFIHLRLPENYDLKKIYENMKKRGYLFRVTGKGLPATLEGCIRITVGPYEQMQEFLNVFQDIFQFVHLNFSTIDQLVLNDY